jgi:hypothetical protein
MNIKKLILCLSFLLLLVGSSNIAIADHDDSGNGGVVYEGSGGR